MDNIKIIVSEYEIIFEQKKQEDVNNLVGLTMEDIYNFHTL
jgi:hypothetical protein